MIELYLIERLDFIWTASLFLTFIFGVLSWLGLGYQPSNRLDRENWIYRLRKRFVILFIIFLLITIFLPRTEEMYKIGFIYSFEELKKCVE